MADKNEHSDIPQGQPQAFAPLPNAGSSSGSSAPPSWAVPQPPKRMRRGRSLTVVLAVVLTVVVATATALITSGFLRGGGAPVADQARTNAPAQQQPAAPTTTAPQQGLATQAVAPQQVPGDLRQGAVYVQSNDAISNVVVAYLRKPDGTLTEMGRYPTGGQGSGKFEDSAHGLVLGSAKGEASPTQNIDQEDLLFVTNAGSNTISVFRVEAGGLELITQVPSGGNRPVSLTVNNGMLYVLNSGETDRRLVLGPDDLLENCTTGDMPSVTGFRVTPAGNLMPIENSTRALSGRAMSGCAQVTFTPDGKTLIVTERIANIPGQTKDRKGAIDTFDVRFDGTLGERKVLDPSGAGPYGFNFLKDGTLLMTEQNGATANPGGGGAVSYHLNSDNSLKAINGTINDGQTDTCWIVVTRDQKTAYATSAFGGGAITAYRVGDNDSLQILYPHADAPDGKDASKQVVKDGLTDLVLSHDTNYLYQLNSVTGALQSFKVNPNGLLTHIEDHQVFQLEPFGQGGQAAPFGLVSW
ncbi:hypothetical protein [Kutzneria buriramensis]|uniref:6-phosphogluconolactonase (Cycloisomerase 2 family) n=1 Tax=Kutzneria buriramensis TaxID=1045776 RepID=A0A3E0GV73_9PSEU|nr:hypothetical protein [Kutzneria buriramensis]REH29637.1 hypothetical protein BCF44_12464 [Kutzneria buriramensis]